MHVVCALYHSEKNPEDYVSHYYKKVVYLCAYRFFLQPVKGMEMWPDTKLGTIEPPTMTKKRGRPKTTRRKDTDEPRDSGKKSGVGRLIPFVVRRSITSSVVLINLWRQIRPQKDKLTTSSRKGTQESDVGTASRQSARDVREELTTVAQRPDNSTQSTTDKVREQRDEHVDWRSFRPQAMTWRGHLAISSRQLQEEQDVRRLQQTQRVDDNTKLLMPT